mmetsp:Transcript_27213/g.80061  ORF Transcript_27213/g.80061 Transcript_27213/m.80061 type:complete len:246 (+) Transcript_27213:101-838(+)
MGIFLSTVALKYRDGDPIPPPKPGKRRWGVVPFLTGVGATLTVVFVSIVNCTCLDGCVKSTQRTALSLLRCECLVAPLASARAFMHRQCDLPWEEVTDCFQAYWHSAWRSIPDCGIVRTMNRCTEATRSGWRDCTRSAKNGFLTLQAHATALWDRMRGVRGNNAGGGFQSFREADAEREESFGGDLDATGRRVSFPVDGNAPAPGGQEPAIVTVTGIPMDDNQRQHANGNPPYQQVYQQTSQPMR